ncbi:MAG: NADH:flavin oxidoreductase/NADH oxidase [Trueperaceae bacterium]|nr:NADH:flavin oxidoreductase/NADH oxidase [Trueperaceae bacterium]
MASPSGPSAGPSAPSLFDPLTLRGVTMRNRVGVSPMCTYSADDGLANPWHVAHLGARAIGGAGLVMAEAAAVEPRGRITPHDVGLWSDRHVDALKPVATAIESQGSVAAIQLAHAGRKASTYRPWAEASGVVPAEQGGWTTVGPTPEPFRPDDPAPTALDDAGIADLIEAFAVAATRAVAAGFRTIEVHAAHGYLLHEFLSPLVNLRDDRWGGPFEARVRFPLAVIAAVRQAVPDGLPVWVRVSASDWRPDGWTVDDTVRFAELAREAGADLIDCSAGGAVPGVRAPSGTNVQVPFAEAVRLRAGVPSAAVGGIVDPAQADAIVGEERADVVLLGREMLRDPFWTLHAAQRLGRPVPWPDPYGWAVAKRR